VNLVVCFLCLCYVVISLHVHVVDVREGYQQFSTLFLWCRVRKGFMFEAACPVE
jgi:hypothetical protein